MLPFAKLVPLLLYILYVIVASHISDYFPFLVIASSGALPFRLLAWSMLSWSVLLLFCNFHLLVSQTKKQLIILAARLICNYLHSIRYILCHRYLQLGFRFLLYSNHSQYVDFFVYFCLCELPFLTVHICQCRYLQSISAYVQNCSCCGILNIISVP